MYNMRKYLLHVLVIALVSICLGGCTSSPYSKVIKPNKILPAYVDPLPYEQYDCSQIGTEMERVTSELDQLYLDVEKRREIDEKAARVAGGVAFFLGPVGGLLAAHAYKSGEIDPGQEKGSGYYKTSLTQYEQLIGELEVLEQASILKECDKRMLPEIPEFRKAFSVFTNVDSIEDIKIGKKEYKLPNVFHRYECQLRNEDFLEYKTAEKAQDAGGKPCEHCKPFVVLPARQG
mgnify:FL=1